MIAIGCDHGGIVLKGHIMQYLTEAGIPYKDFGTSEGVPCDYPDMAKTVCDAVASGECDKAVLICGTGIGICMSANKIKGIRAAVCHDCFSAKFTRLHNDANVICFGERVIGAGHAIENLKLFLSTEFEGGRHARRVDKIMSLEK